MKTVYLTWVFHGNMSYDRYTKTTIRTKFPETYQIMIDDFLRHPTLKGQVELSGLTVESLKRWAPQTITQLRTLAERGQVRFTASYYAAPVNACLDGNTNLGALDLGTRIVAQNCGPVDGLFCQEESYTPQLPWAMKQLGIEWVTVTRKGGRNQPFLLRGHDGTTVYGIPICRERGKLKEHIRQAPDGSLWIFIGDYEMYNSLTPVLDMVEELAQEGIRVELTLVSDYLRQHPPAEAAYYEVCWDLEPVESPSFSRWVCDPDDIRMHAATVDAMHALRDAEILAAVATATWELPPGLASATGSLASDLRTLAIEQPEEFPHIEETYLPEETLPALAKAKHLLYWGVNSDARGWYPLPERRWEHENALRRSASHSQAVIQSALQYIEERLATPGDGQTFLLYNGTGARSAWLRLPDVPPGRIVNSAGEPLPAVIKPHDHGHALWTKVALPAYGYTTVSLTGAADSTNPPMLTWSAGDTISTGDTSLTYKDGTLAISAGEASYSLSLLAPAIWRELTQKNGQVARDFTGGSAGCTRIWPALFPHLQIHQELLFGVHLLQEYMLEPGAIRCRWRFDFTKPYLLGPEERFQAAGLAAVLQAAPGDIFYDAGYSVVSHPYRTPGYIAALHFAGWQGPAGGATITSLTGSQSFLADAGQGRLGIGLGATTLVGPAEQPDQLFVDVAKKQIRHYNTFDEALFFGAYEHEFVLRFYQGDWQHNDMAAQALAESLPIRLRLLRPGRHPQSPLPPEQSLVAVSGGNIKIQAAKCRDGLLRLLLNEPTGTTTPFQLQAAGRSRAGLLPAGALQYVDL